MRAARSSSEENTTARPSCSNSWASAAERLRIAPLRREVAEQRDQPALRLERLAARRDDRAVDPRRALGREPLAQRLAGHRHAIEVEQRLQLAQQRAHAAGGEEVLHVAVADRLQVDQHRRRVGQLVELIERHLHAGAAGDGGQMDDRVGRAAERQQHAQRVLDRLGVDDPVGRAASEPISRTAARAGRLGGAQPVGVHGRDRGGAGQRSCRAPRRCRPWWRRCPSPRRCRR